MAERHPSYESIKALGPNKKCPASTAILRYWEHMENVHGATPEDYGMNVKKWHTKHHPECTTMPTFEEAKAV